MAEITVFVFFASSEKTKADFGAGGKEPDAIEKLINLHNRKNIFSSELRPKIFW